MSDDRWRPSASANSFAITAAIESPDEKRCPVIWWLEPITSATAIVSPMARPSPSITAPTTPLLALYALLRHSWHRDRRSLEDAVALADDDEALEQFLARRALDHLPYRRLRRLSENPWRDYEDGHTAALADAELARVGLRRPRRAGA